VENPANDVLCVEVWYVMPPIEISYFNLYIVINIYKNKNLQLIIIIISLFSFISIILSSVYLLYNFRDFDPAETVREKMMKIGEVKGVRGLRKLMKEIAVTASTGKHDNELVGSAALPLKVLLLPGINSVLVHL
jgi:uncharacterized membrane protein (DUF485 family)